MAIESRSATSTPDAGGQDVATVAIHKLELEGFAVFEASRAKRSDNDFTFDSLADFMVCARELGIRVIFIEKDTLEEDDFFEDPPDRRSPLDPETDSPDLRRVEKQLKAFERHIGEAKLVVATGCAGAVSISYFEAAPWLDEYERLRELAIEQLDASRDEEEEQLEREREEATEEMLARIRALATDQNFRSHFATSRPTQGAIVAYIRTEVDGAAELPARVIRDAANHLRDHLLLGR